MLIRLRHSTTDPEQITGYAVALPGHRSAAGRPVFYGGGRLAADLSLPRLRHRWGTHPPDTESRGVGSAERVEALHQAADTVRAAADDIRRNARGNHAGAQAAAQGAADVLTALAHAVDGERQGSLSRAAEVFDRAARDLNGRVARATARSYQLRAMSRLIALMGRISDDEDTLAALTLVLDLARLSDSLEYLRTAQHRWHQAEAARSAANTLRAAGNGW